MIELSPREREYLRLRAHGLSQRQVADKMQTTLQTAKNYQTKISQKVLGEDRETGYPTLVQTLYAMGWITIPEET